MADYVIERDRSYQSPGIMLGRIVNVIVGLIEFLLTVRLILQLLGANPNTEFVGWIFSITDTLMTPFAGAFPTMQFLWGTLDFSVLLAMLGYWFLGWLLIYIIDMVTFP